MYIHVLGPLFAAFCLLENSQIENGIWQLNLVVSFVNVCLAAPPRLQAHKKMAQLDESTSWSFFWMFSGEF
jgi:hypothetical protein